MSGNFPSGRLAASWAAATARIDALSDRDRHVLLLGALAVLVASELFWVQPMGTKRQAVMAAAGEQAASAATERARAEQALAKARSELDARAARLDNELQRLGAERATGEPLSQLLRRVLARHGVAIVALRSLEVLEVDAGAGAAAPAPATERTRLLFKHRLELTLGADAAALVAAVGTLDRDARPLRIERVRLLASESAGTPQAVITLAVLGTRRTWLSI
jgi:hypothetical protein